MTHKPLLNILIVVGLLALPLALGRGPAAQAAPEATIFYVKPGGIGGCTSWEDACELQTALSEAATGDEIWVAQGIYKPTSGVPYESCQAIREADPTAPDGDYLIQNDGNAYLVYCHDMAGTPKEYLSLDSAENYSQYTAGGAASGTDVRTNYSKVRLLPDTLQVDISDQTFATSSGSLQQGSTLVTSMPYAVAMDCKLPPSHTGVAHIDLRGTPFAIHPDETFILGGYYPDGSATLTDNRQVVSLQGGGYCGWIQPEPYIYTPVNGAGGPILELEHIQPERRATFQMKSGVALYGGFPSGGGDWTQRDWQAHPTVLSGDIGTPDVNNDNVYNVLFGREMTEAAVLDGFVITGGYAWNAPTYDQNFGGGLFAYDGKLRLENLVFEENSAGMWGGGLYVNASDVALLNVTFNSNSAEQGGGMFNNHSTATLTNVTFSGNSAEEGGGIKNYFSSPRLINVSFIGNGAGWGAGMSNQNGDPWLINSVFLGNTADYDGGAIHNYNDSSPNLINVTLVSNSAGRGGGMDSWDSSSPSLTNTILWGNTASIEGPQIYNPNPAVNTVTVSYSLVGGGCPVDVNCDHLLSDDPQFVDAEGGNLRLLFTSPAIDAGNNAAVPPEVTTDLDGSPRMVDIPGVRDPGAIVDMGAYEAQVGSGIIYVDKTASGPIHDGTSWGNAFTGLQTGLAAAQSGNEIWVAAGVYFPGIIGSHLATFQLKSGVKLYGGFDPDSGADTFEERDWTENVTVLSGDIDGNDVTDPNGVVTDTVNIQGENAYHVVTGSAVVTETAVLDGFTITAGDADGEAWPQSDGGGMTILSGSPTLTNLAFAGNSAIGLGGGIFIENSPCPDCSPALTGISFSGNSASEAGGGLFIFGNSLTLTDATFTGNSGGNVGGGMVNVYGETQLTGVHFSRNPASGAASGGGRHEVLEAGSTLTNVTFFGNQAGYGGGLYNEGRLTLVASTVGPGNNVSIMGGGMINHGEMVISGSTVVGNSGTGIIGGAGIANYGTLEITNTTISGNFTNENGGGIFHAGGSLVLTNATITANIANHDGIGGGSGAGIYASAPVLVKNSIIANNLTGGDCVGLVSSLGYNIDSDDTCQLDGTGDKPDTDPQLGPLAENGGPTLTHALLAGSPAIDAGDPLLCILIDQRGMPRPVDGDLDELAVCDMGAYEYQPPKLYLPLMRK